MTQQPMNSDLTSDDRLWALLSWLFWPVAVIMLLMDDKKTRPFIKYNAVLSLGLRSPVVRIGNHHSWLLVRVRRHLCHRPWHPVLSGQMGHCTVPLRFHQEARLGRLISASLKFVRS